MRSVCLPAFAKVNSRLHLLGKRPDGYHELRTILQTISLHDTLELTLRARPGIEIESTEPEVPSGRENLVWQALDDLRRELRIRSGVRVRLEKRIPVARGLGGGSSDAAAALVGFLRLTRRRLPPERLLEMAAKLGADVPFFVWGGRALGVGRGDEIYPLPDGPKRAVLVVSPQEIAVSTRDAYRWASSWLTKGAAASRLWSFCTLCWSQPEDKTSVWNDFEAVVFQRYPRLGEIKRALLRAGAAEAALAGSGSAVFGMFQDPAQARRAAQKFPKDQVFIAETLSRVEYRRALHGRGAI